MTKKRSNSQNKEEEDSETEDQNLTMMSLGEEQVATLRLVETTDQALELIDSLSNQPQRFEGDPGDLFDQMDEMRQSLQSAWKNVLEDEEDNNNEGDSKNDKLENDPSNPRGSKRGRGGQAQANSSSNNKAEEAYRSSYVDTMAAVLEDPLDAMRQQHEQDDKARLDIDIDVIVDALQSGIDLLHPEEKNALFRRTTSH
mmetsp:Transcript_26997/g.65523  ORF Transcript_26997/g.65523 Transcript_26997/m.65523 type:complete len:199 (-) Transcript_26997:340-936(-)